MGCLAERYREEIKKELPEVDAVFGTESWDDILGYLGFGEVKKTKRLITTPRSYAYVKLSEGCNRLCSFCAIPSIRGRHRSRPLEDILTEVKELAKRGTKEICLISQDTTFYGKDLYGEFKLPHLLKEIEKIEGIEWVRLLYLYPTEVSDELLEIISSSQKILPYFDIPLQHISSPVLKAMRRGYDEKFVRNLIKKIKDRVKDAVLRTSFIVGFPTETDEDFKKLLSFVEEGHFHWVGVFTYSHEEGTPAHELGDRVPEEVKEERKEALTELQSRITEEKNKEFLGKELKVLIDGYDEEFGLVPVGRAYFQAPEADGVVYVQTDERKEAGSWATVRITQVALYDLAGQETHKLKGREVRDDQGRNRKETP